MGSSRSGLLVGAAAAVAVAIAAVLLVGRGAAPPPNLVVVMVDTLRADHLGYHGYARATSPRIDALARESTVFRNHHAHASRTGPSVASVLTGLHPRSHGVVNPLTRFDAKGTLGDEQTTLAEILAAHGYRARGFTSNINVGPRFGFAQGFETYEYVRSESAADVNRAAAAALDELPEPFFLYLHYLEPHSPYAAAPAHAWRFVEPGYRGPVTGAHEQLDEIVAGRFPVDAADVEQLRGLYDQEIRDIDDRVGELLELLERRGVAGRTLLLFVADHGEELLDHGSALHGYTLYEEQLHVPCFLHDPRDTVGRSVDGVTRNVDLLPTLLELLGIEHDGPLQGRSLVARVEGREDPPEEPPVFAQASLRAVKTVQRQSLAWGGWKVIETTVPEPRVELYHLAADPAETRDLAETEPARATEMLDRLREFAAALPVGEGGVVELTEEERERLRALGYLN